MGDAPVWVPSEGEVIVRARAVAVNEIDAIAGVVRQFVLPWLHYPTVLGSDVAGEVVAIGPSVSSLAIGDRVVGYAVGVEQNRNDPAEGAFQTHVKLPSHMCARIPKSMSFQEACVLPLALTTAAAGLFEKEHLSLELPTAEIRPRNETVLIFGGATSVGMNAIQLARNAGYSVLATASATNFSLLEGLGAGVLVDYHEPDFVEQIIGHLSGGQLAGTLAVANGSLRDAITVNASDGVSGTRRIASAHPTPATRIRGALARRRQIQVSAIWGGSPKDTFVGPAMWNAFLPDALANGRYTPAPPFEIAGHGLQAIPPALARVRKGVRAKKIIIM
ncbi:zinc-binding alcohol dehydrogenase family protein [Glaciihabitans sp. UYNi722]|uniref:zinc-binding alcohol dehydrogenase family protein n=1 Tax=Glaciihabitans sp. UYNi722 TaxID=3156344 RepID=UPI0033961692